MRGERKWKEGGRDWRRGREGETREIMEGGVTEEEWVSRERLEVRVKEA